MPKTTVMGKKIIRWQNLIGRFESRAHLGKTTLFPLYFIHVIIFITNHPSTNGKGAGGETKGSGFDPRISYFHIFQFLCPRSSEPHLQKGHHASSNPRHQIMSWPDLTPQACRRVVDLLKASCTESPRGQMGL